MQLFFLFFIFRVFAPPPPSPTEESHTPRQNAIAVLNTPNKAHSLKPVKKLKGLESFNATCPQDDVGVNPLDTAFSGMTLEVLKEIGEYYLEDEIEEPIKEKNSKYELHSFGLILTLFLQ